MGVAELVTIRETPGAKICVVFVHGFGGDATATWGKFPEYLTESPGLDGWDLYSLGYSSSLAPDLRGLWSGDPDITTLATYLRTRCDQPPLAGKRLALIAHSMGGLVVQRALLEKDLAANTSHVMLYGTPSNGLEKAAGFLGRIIKRQSGDMALGSPFVTDLRSRWQTTYGQARPFVFRAVAGDRDEFVPADSSLSCFEEGDRAVVPGNHLQIVKPDTADSMSVKEALACLVGDAAPGGPWSAANVALELGDFRKVIEQLEPNASELDDRHLVKLALALDATGERDKATAILEARGDKGTDAMGVLAGRLKRDWLATGRAEPARRALELYREAYDLSRQAQPPNHAQAFYHGINVAFMELVSNENLAAAQAIASEVLEHCAGAKKVAGKEDHWCAATRGEAHLYLHETEQALGAYREAVAKGPKPRELDSMYTQAWRAAEALDNQAAATQLDQVFKGRETS